MMCLCYSVIPHVERVLDDAADHLRREVGEPRSEGRGEGVEVVALVLSEAARRDHFLQVRNRPHFFIEPGGSVAMSSTTALHAINE